MSIIRLNAVFAYRTDTLENWQDNNTLLERGEISIVIDKTDTPFFLKIGDGVHGWNDLPYAKGPQGIQGIQGPKGDKGDKGDAGSLGSVTASVDNNTGTPSVNVTYDGTNANFAFHNLKGNAGPQGVQGIKGDKGDTGSQGPAGADGQDGVYITGAEINSSGHLIITLSDESSVDAGYAKGSKGDTGEQGPQGIQGIQGPAGEKGAKGDTGNTGATGPQGPKGDKGDQGIQGPQGPKGEKGDDGITPDMSNYYTKTETAEALETKVDKVTGKGLSTNDFTNAYKGQLDNFTTNVRNVRPEVLNTMGATTQVNTLYDLGEQSTLAITLPQGQLGDWIEFDFLSGATATNLTITSAYGMSDFDIVPEVNTGYSIYCSWAKLDSTTYGWVIKSYDFVKATI